MKNIAVDTSIWGSLLQAGPIVQLILMLLILMSVISWGIILGKWYQFIQLKKSNFAFLGRFGKSKNLVEVAKESRIYLNSSNMARLFDSAYQAFLDLQEQKKTMESTAEYELVILERELGRTIRNEIGNLESKLNWLASTGSTAPFIGLLGTVWGLLNSFQKIGAMGNASLAVVAPGISEALVATAVGLFAAIPATLFYNHFINKIRESEIEMNDLAQDLVTLMKRQIGG